MHRTEELRNFSGPTRIRFKLIESALALLIVACTLGLVRSAQAQTYTVLYQFSGGDGDEPYGRLTLFNGTLYGTTLGGGLNYAGVVYSLTTGGKETVLHSFGTPSTDGRSPEAGLIHDSSGNLYGTTQYGGAYGDGTIFKLTGTGQETVLLNFDRYNGERALSGLIPDAWGNLYGTTNDGGNYGYGAVFKLAPTRALTVLHSFNFGQQDGQYPSGGLVRDSYGNLYGTTTSGGTYNHGVVFKLSSTGHETILHSFGATGDGEAPNGDLVMDGNGNLYGTTSQGGTHYAGTVFKISATGSETILHNFGSFYGDGSRPTAGLVRDLYGNLYGTTNGGGPFGSGTVFKLTSTGLETLLHSFVFSDGSSPNAPLIRDSSGNLYGTTSLGGAGYGVVFKLTP